MKRLAIVFVLLGALAASCKSDCPSEPEPDLSTPTEDQGVVTKPDLQGWPNCKKGKVTCAAGEIDAFGICLGSATMVKVRAGEFPMGFTQPGKPWDPEHKVTLKEFVIDATEVSVAAYKACVDCGACKPPFRNGSNTGREPYFGNPAYADYPVVYVTWKDAKGYCEAIGKRLPTEAEWEMAARGSEGNVYPWGATPPEKFQKTCVQANFGGLLNDTVPVSACESGKSPTGALNLAGNVWEWVADSYDAAYYASSPTTDPKGPAVSTIKVVRGGSFDSAYEPLKTYYRIGYAEGTAYSSIGFRCAKDRW